MPVTPKRAKRDPRPNSRFLSDVLADNLRAYRTLRRLSQEDLAERMDAIGWENWVRATVSEVERSNRGLGVDELLALASILAVTINDLLDPTGIDGRGETLLDFSPASKPMTALQGRAWVRGKAICALKWDGGPRGVQFRPAPDDPVTYSDAALTGVLAMTKTKREG